MPTVPTNPKCGTLGCRNPRTKYSSMCEEHGGKTKIDYKRYLTKERREVNKYYNTPQWVSFRQRQLSTHPLCACCLLKGKYVQANDIDHVFPWRKIGEEAFYINVFQSLCKSCHTSKTSWEKAGFIKHYTDRENTYRMDEYTEMTAFLR